MVWATLCCGLFCGVRWLRAALCVLRFDDMLERYILFVRMCLYICVRIYVCVCIYVCVLCVCVSVFVCVCVCCTREGQHAERHRVDDHP
jgi:hypothetical protein